MSLEELIGEEPPRRLKSADRHRSCSSRWSASSTCQGPAALRHADDRYRARSAGPLKSAAKGGTRWPRPSTPRVVPVEHITQSILVLRGQKVLLDAELAALYGVTTRRLNEQVKRNTAALPRGFHVPAHRRRSRDSEPVAICDRFPEAAATRASSRPTPSPSTAPSWPPPS